MGLRLRNEERKKMKLKHIVAVPLIMIMLGAISCVQAPTEPTIIYKNPKPFPDLSTLITWLVNDNTDEQMYVTDTHDCDDFAMDLQKAAMEDGYIINVQFDLEGSHALNSVIINEGVFFIEPQTDEIMNIGTLDEEEAIVR
jgi:hypothetical protein